MAAYPIISVNGNFAALCSTNIVKLSRLIPANTEVNLFHRSPERERLIKQELENLGAEKVLGSFSDESAIVPGLTSSRKFVHTNGIYKADVVMLSLEDGDCTQALVEMGKKVIDYRHKSHIQNSQDGGYHNRRQCNPSHADYDKYFNRAEANK